MAKSLQINDLFWTVQGEGRFTGRRALFVRLPFCNYNCPWCDTNYNSFKEYSEQDFLNFANQEPCRFAVITGGEPTAHKHLPRIIEILKNLGFYIACETNGSLKIPEGIDFATISPKFYSKNLKPYFVEPTNYDKCGEWKYVVDDKFDFAILDRHKNSDCRCSLSPEFSNFKVNTDRIIDYIKRNPKWELSLQTHKWIEIP